MEIEELKECFSDEINLISERLCHVKSEKHILKWLQNFEEEHWLFALEILQNLYYLSEADLYNECDKMIGNLLEHIDAKSHVYFNPIAKYGKSSTLLTYYIGKSKKFKQLMESGRATYLESKHEIASVTYHPNSTLVFFDDFFGTGGSLKTHFEQFIDTPNDSFKEVESIFGACIYYMNQAKDLITDQFPQIKIIGNLHDKIFGANPNYFGTSALLTKYKNLAHTYARDKFLFKGRYKHHCLGYQDSEAFISFAYSPPNNTLPILWSSKSNWYPLLPRDQDDVLTANNEFREQLAVISSKSLLNMPKEIELEHGASKKKFIVYGMLRLLDEGVALPVIARKIGITTFHLDEYLTIAKQMKFIDNNNRLTHRGEEQAKWVNEYVSYLKKQNNTKFTFNEVDYTPKAFSG